MKRIFACMFLCVLLMVYPAQAEKTFATNVTVVSIDLKAQSMMLRELPGESATPPPKLKEYVVFWDKDSKFVKAGATWADPDIPIRVEDVKKDDKVYVIITDRFFSLPGQIRDKLWIETLKFMH